MNQISTKIEIENLQKAIMLDEDTAEKLKRFHMHWCFQDAGCLMKYHDNGPRGENSPIIPYAPFARSRVYTGTRETGSYNHHMQLTKFKDRYFVSWSNGYADEEAGGQRILISSSKDGKEWSEAVCVAGGQDHPNIAYNSNGLMVMGDSLFLLGMKEDTQVDADSVGMRRINPESQQTDIYTSMDGVSWMKVYSFSKRIRQIFEAPRLTFEGRLLCAAGLVNRTPANLLWPGDNLLEEPEIIPVKQPKGANFNYGEGTWYQRKDGVIIMFNRDEGASCRAWVNYSEDGGRTFTEPVISDIPDSMSRLYAGVLDDGRYYLVNNAFYTLLNRRHLLMLISDDGYKFTKVYNLVDDPTAQRLTGLLKGHGYQYPCCIVDGEKLLVSYSVNKEDIEVGIIDTSKIQG